jgi:uncharacterized phage protein (TIGR02218 family)
MPYDDYEQTLTDSRPIECYDLADISGQHWRYTSSRVEQTLLNHVYSPEVIKSKELEITDNHFKNLMEITLSKNNLFAFQYFPGTPESKVTLTIYRMQSTDYIYYWSGVVQIVSFNTDGLATVKAAPLSSDIVRVGTRRRCQIMCDLCLYGLGCNVNRESFKVDGTITTISGTTVTSSAFATKTSGWFTAGLLVVGNARRLIRSHTTNTITISRAILNAAAGTSLTAYAGCDHLPTTCLTKFINKPNYGGCEFLPLTNPFTTSLIHSGSSGGSRNVFYGHISI